MLRLAIVSISLTGCIIEHDGGGGPPPESCINASAPIDTGASIDHQAGVDAGYYAQYTTGGHWHFDWTCDTKLSAIGCEFSGTIFADDPGGGINATCFQCEPQDVLTTTQVGTQTRIDFDTGTSTGLDGVDFTSIPGNAVKIDLQINGIYQNDLVFLPSGGQTLIQPCMPIDLLPSTP
jgi:hypothetical protein